MKKAIKLFLLLLFFQATSTAQISIDSIHVFQSSGQIVDSVYVQGVSNGQVLNRVLRSPANDLCGTLYISMYFRACNPNQSIPFNTTIQFGFSSDLVRVSAVWDTLAGCSFPTLPFATDVKIWDNCFTSSLSEKNQASKIKIAPNPTQDQIQITFEKSVSIEAIELYNIDGKLVKQFTTQERALNVQDIVSGVYFLRVESKEGSFTKKVVIQN